MKLGMNMHLWSTCITSDHFPVIERLREIGYDGIEVFLAHDDDANYRELAGFCASIGMAANGCLGLGADCNPASTDASIRQAGLDAIKAAIDRLHLLGGRTLLGPFHSAVGVFSGAGPTEDELARSAEVMYAAAEHAAGAGVILLPEALNRFECYLLNTMEQLAAFVSRVGHPNLRAMFDTHHAVIEEKNNRTAIQAVAPMLELVHLSENDRGAVGSGQVHWESVFASLAEINFDGWLTVEAFGRQDADFARAVHVWRDFDGCWDICENSFAFVQGRLQQHGLMPA